LTDFGVVGVHKGHVAVVGYGVVSQGVQTDPVALTLGRVVVVTQNHTPTEACMPLWNKTIQVIGSI